MCQEPPVGDARLKSRTDGGFSGDQVIPATARHGMRLNTGHMDRRHSLLLLLTLVGLLLSACAGGGRGTPASAPGEVGGPTAANPATSVPTLDPAAEIVTILPKDAISSIDDPQFYPIAEANEEYDDEEEVIGIEMEGEARAYSTGLLSSHEIVNDNVKGRPIAVTW